jgi:UDP-N-acetylglucosamine--N-acetylmuramyl-(pentapeptide) pyrophosphoryl-undecaprenol N-acetylglucosamine transferase
VVGAAAALSAEGRLPRLVHQTGPADEARVRDLYARAGLAERVDIRPFIDDMPATLAAASLVVGRAGALTLAELAMVGRPAILIPLPTAADDHQSRNAESFARAGAAVVVRQGTATAGELARLIGDLVADPARRAAMAQAMTTLARPRAAVEIVDELEAMTGAAGHAGAPA